MTSRQTIPMQIILPAWRTYLSRLRESPLVTKSLTSAILSFLSDILAKRIAKQPFKSSSAIHEFMIGLILRGPGVHYFQRFLENILFVRAKNHKSPRVVLAKLVIDQLCFAPPFLASYLVFTSLLVDTPLAVTRKRIQAELPRIIMRNWMFWVPANLVGYAAIPEELRVAWSSVVGIAWTAILISSVPKPQIVPTATSS